MQGNSIQDSMQLINTFLEPVRNQAQKEAALKQAAEDSSVSFKDTKPANPEEQAKQQAPATSQTNLGKEQTQAAVDSASNVNSVQTNSDSDASSFSDTQGTQTLTTDDPVKSDGNLGPTRTQEITQEQKVARARGLGNAILEVLYKEAGGAGDAANPGMAGGSAQPAAQQAAPTPTRAPASIQNDADGMAAGNDKTASQMHPVMQKMAAEAALAAQQYYEGYFKGMIKRAHDEYEVANSGIPDQLLHHVGGVAGLLDKVAMEFPEAVLPEEEMPVMPGPEAGGMDPAAAMGGMGEMGEGDPTEELAAALDEAGVTPEELAQAVQDVQALQEAGIEPEELAGAMGEIIGGEGGEVAEAPAPEAAPESPAPEAGAEESEEKEASQHLSPVALRVREILSR